MRRRVKPVPVTEAGVPVLIAAGPHVPTWAEPGQLERLDRLEDDDPAREALTDAMLFSGRRRWARARQAWLDEQSVPQAEQCRLVPLRRPYW